jgi:TolB protein
MAQHDDLDRMLSAWLDDPYTPPAPRYLTQVLERTRHTRQRPAWASLERWIPMADKVLQPTTAPPMRLAWVLLITLLVIAVAAVAVVGARLLPASTIPQGGAAVFTFGSITPQTTARDILTVRADGLDQRQLTRGTSTRSHPAFSPDGTHIAYRDWQNGIDSIVVTDAGGGHPITLARTPAAQEECVRGGLAWSPDGTSLIFPTAPACGAEVDLSIVPTDGSSPATKLLAPGVTGFYPAWSPDGRRIAFLGHDAGGSPGMYVADVGPGGALAGGLQARRIASAPNGEGMPADLSGPRWSPDGTELVAASERNGIVILRADGSGERVLAETPDNPMWSPDWSPDGKQIAYYRAVDTSERFNDRPCTVRTWVVDADGTDGRQLDPLGDGCDVPVSWSPDGTRLAILLLGPDPALEFRLGIITLDGSQPVVMLPDATSGSWQPVAAPLPPAPSFPAP